MLAPDFGEISVEAIGSTAEITRRGTVLVIDKPLQKTQTPISYGKLFNDT
jgi:hypothetical protein